LAIGHDPLRPLGLVDSHSMSDPVALALIAGIVTLGTAFLGAWGRRMATQTAAAAAELAGRPDVIS
jgi:hypothetical protein